MKWNLPCDHMLEQYIFSGDAMEPNWDKYASMFDEQKFDVYEGRKVAIAQVEAEQDSQGIHVLNRAMVRSKFDLDETANKIKDRRFFLEDRIRQSGMPVENAERVMRAYNRSFTVAIRQLQSLSLDALLAMELEEEASQIVVE
jgi:hypothetical protein